MNERVVDLRVAGFQRRRLRVGGHGKMHGPVRRGVHLQQRAAQN